MSYRRFASGGRNAEVARLVAGDTHYGRPPIDGGLRHRWQHRGLGGGSRSGVGWPDGLA